MSETSSVWDGVSLGDASAAPYSAAEWAALQNLLHGVGTTFLNYGVLRGTGDGTNNPLAVLEASPTAKAVKVQTGSALVNGRVYTNSAIETLAVADNSSGFTRIDSVILRVDVLLQTVRLVVKQGTPAASPARPTLTQDASTWEIALADLTLNNGYATVTQTNILQRQRYVGMGAVGWQPYAHQLEYVNGTYSSATKLDMNSAGDSLAVPVALYGNMLLDDVSVYYGGTAVAHTWGWDMYVQDTNDGLTAENTLRRVAECNTNSSSSGGSGLEVAETKGGAVYLPAGLYWLVIQNRAATPFSVAYLTVGSLITRTSRTKNTSNPNGNTLDFSTGWANATHSYGVRLRGRVFGETADF